MREVGKPDLVRDWVHSAVVIGNSIQVVAADAKHLRVLRRDLIQFDIHVEVYDLRPYARRPSAERECAQDCQGLQRCRFRHSNWLQLFLNVPCCDLNVDILRSGRTDRRWPCRTVQASFPWLIIRQWCTTMW